MKELCVACCKETEMTLHKAKQYTALRGRAIKHLRQYYTCNHCGAEAPSNELFNANLMNLYITYKEVVGMLSHEEMKQIRMELHYSEMEMARIIGCSEEVILRLEKGAIPTTEQDSRYKELITLKQLKLN